MSQELVTNPVFFMTSPPINFEAWSDVSVKQKLNMNSQHIILLLLLAQTLHALKPSEAADVEDARNPTGLALPQTQDRIVKPNSTNSRNWCADFDWKGNEIKVVEDCDVLKDEIQVELFRLTNKSECITFADLSIQGKWMETWYNEKGGKNRIVHFENTFKEMRSNTTRSSSRVEVAFRLNIVTQDFEWNDFTTKFFLDTQNCATKDAAVKSTEIVGSAIGVGAAIIGLILIAAITAVGYRLKKKRGQEDISKTDENVVYGTYSRGWEGEGDYGDGDTVYVTDTNDFYG